MSARATPTGAPAMQWAFRALYVGLLVAWAAFGRAGQWSDAAMFAGLALAIDPFDQRQGWTARPRWQRGWLLGHLGLLAATILVAVHA